MLTSRQLAILRHDLRTLAHIEYEEVENEPLDHYATLTEQKMIAGQDFENASAYAWAELGAGPGLHAIQRDFEMNIKKQVSARHLDILKNYFRWPTIVTTLLIGIVMYLLATVLPGNLLPVLLWVFLIIPFVITHYLYYKGRNQKGTSKYIICKSLGYRASISTNIAIIFLNIPFLEDNSKKVDFLRSHISISAVLCFVAILYLLSILQLYHEKFHYKTA